MLGPTQKKKFPQKRKKKKNPPKKKKKKKKKKIFFFFFALQKKKSVRAYARKKSFAWLSADEQKYIGISPLQNGRRAASLIPNDAVLSVFFCFRGTPTHRPPELTQFPMPAVGHENKGNPAMDEHTPRSCRCVGRSSSARRRHCERRCGVAHREPHPKTQAQTPQPTPHQPPLGSSWRRDGAWRW